MSQVPSNAGNPSGDPNDPLANLYRMSKTAGLASSDYKAVNIPAVIALLLGLASALASFEITLVVLAVVGLVVGVMAVVQIRGSNGTQTGLPLAILGILLSLGLGTWAATGRYREFARTAEDRRQLLQSIETVGNLVNARKFQQAYDEHFSPSFHERISLAKFEDVWSQMNRSPRGKLTGLTSNGLFTFEVDSSTQARLAVGQVIMNFEKGTPGERPEIFFQWRDGKWWIENIKIFPSPAQPAAPPGS